MGRDLIVGMSATFLVWGAAIAWASSRLVWRNLDIYRRWFAVDRDTRVKMALWLAVPMLIIAVLMQRARAFYALATERWTSDFGEAFSIVFLSLALAAMALALFWAFDRQYGPVQGDRLWCHLMRIGLAAGAVASLLSWWF